MKRRSPFVSRAHQIRIAESRLRSHSFPRLQMLLLVALTGGFGLLASFGLLHAGLGSMAIRYPLALALAYGFFLFLLWLWLRTRFDDYLQGVDPAAFAPSPRSSGGAPVFSSGCGGDFAGGGASASFESPGLEMGEMGSAPAKAAGKAVDAVGAVGDADELAVPLIAIVIAAAVALGLALAAVYMVYIAPVLFAELLVDGALSYALFRHLRSEDRPHWMASALRHTLVPFVATAVFLALVGAGLAWYAPGAKSIGQVVQRLGAEPQAK